MTEGRIEIEDVKRLALRPGDILVLRLAQETSWEVKDRIGHKLQELVPGHKVAVLDPGMELEVVEPETVIEAGATNA